MWLLRAPPFGRKGAESDADAQDEEELRAEAEELKAKLEAIRAADYREQLRASCAATEAATKLAKLGEEAAAAGLSPSQMSMLGSTSTVQAPAVQAPAVQAPVVQVPAVQVPAQRVDAQPVDEHGTEHFQFFDDDTECQMLELDDMYDFSRFVPGAPGSPSRNRSSVRTSVVIATPPPAESQPSGDRGIFGADADAGAGAGAAKPPPRDPADGKAQLPKAENEAARLAAAEEALRLLRDRVERHGMQLGPESASLRQALQEAEVALEGLNAIKASKASDQQAPSPSLETSTGKTGKSCEAGNSAPADLPDRSPEPEAPALAFDEEQVLELARITEELTDALEVSRESEESARRQLEVAAAQLEEERRLYAQRERELQEAREAQERELATLRSLASKVSSAAVENEDALSKRSVADPSNADLHARYMEQERQLATERARAKLLEERAARVALENGLERALANKGRQLRWRHLEV
mmetsp:Transcript_36600/g.80164  ORF Transcript_36600/g.80164 Transcript_36600/m.80164 type:complete len:473 (+) Transcript_36600:53-1471(+)